MAKLFCVLCDAMKGIRIVYDGEWERWYCSECNTCIASYRTR